MKNSRLYAITGANGRTGSAAARYLLECGAAVRVVLRNDSHAASWLAQGAEVAIADLGDRAALTKAFTGVHGAYIVSPQQYAREDLFDYAEHMASNVAHAVRAAGVTQVVALSSVGADRTEGSGWIAMNRVLEQRLLEAGLNVACLRAAYFMENWQSLLPGAVAEGVLHSFVAPLSVSLPMVATEDIGRCAAQLLLEGFEGSPVVELEGPQGYSPADVAQALAGLLGKAVRAEVIAVENWPAALAQAGFSRAGLAGFSEMTQALNAGQLHYAKDGRYLHRRGATTLQACLGRMLQL
ncbi:MAG: Quinone oxidoreductase 2 [Stenotrophomonas maltophilia]|nr:MAG: Quinone oxidoreductase 2 [Stenotrophomonas maltophilia]